MRTKVTIDPDRTIDMLLFDQIFYIFKILLTILDMFIFGKYFKRLNVYIMRLSHKMFRRLQDEDVIDLLAGLENGATYEVNAVMDDLNKDNNDDGEKQDNEDRSPIILDVAARIYECMYGHIYSPGLAERIVALLSHDDDVAPLFALVPPPPPLPPPASVPPATAVIVVDSRREVLIAFATPA
ncbi:hypothetical protein GQX74_008429 [Glossina fuscipes]|nr:hypothetical protein GQX74_008429 [Glossina fuscipes]